MFKWYGYYFVGIIKKVNFLDYLFFLNWILSYLLKNSFYNINCYEEYFERF